jgi:hypothetical protein
VIKFSGFRPNENLIRGSPTNGDRVQADPKECRILIPKR